MTYLDHAPIPVDVDVDDLPTEAEVDKLHVEPILVRTPTGPRWLEPLRDAPASLDAAASIVAAFDALDPEVRDVVLEVLVTDPEVGLSELAVALHRGGANVVHRTAWALHCFIFLAEGPRVFNDLGGGEPWLTIKRGIWDVTKAMTDGGSSMTMARRRDLGAPRPS
jgi:hypothetical protein